MKPFLKWAGNKIRIINHIKTLLPQADTLIEPFLGSGAVFLNTNFNNYILNDINVDLINLYKSLQKQGQYFIDLCKKLFVPKNNNRSFYYQIRNKFNFSQYNEERAAFFLYLNRHGYNGLCRYNSNNIFNVPFGLREQVYFPEKEMNFFHIKAQKAKFYCKDYRKILLACQKNKNIAVYCDPPYVPLTITAKFTRYSQQDFSEPQQQELALYARALAKKNIPVLISNHDTPFTRQLYKGANFTMLQVMRTISCSTRDLVPEILALF